MQLTTGRASRLLGACALLTGGIGGAVLAAGTADAAACDGTAVGSCTLTGTASLTGGALTLTSPTSLTWAATLTGTDAHTVATTAGDEAYDVTDATGSGAGWDVTAAATTFTATGPLTLPDATTLSTNGSITDATAPTSPGAACVVVTTPASCTVPDNTLTGYPVGIPTAVGGGATTTVYQAAVASGLGAIAIGGTAPVAWWVDVPAAALPGTYTSTITLTISTGPPG